MMMSMHHGMALLLLVLSTSSAELDGYVDPTYNCPATTTCPQLCVSDIDACPPAMTCGSNMTLCEDGSCRTSALECSLESGENPCSLCAPVACAKIVATYDVCLSAQPLYEIAAECAAISPSSRSRARDLGQGGNPDEEPIGWDGALHIAGYVWLAVVTLGIIVWCWFNNRWDPVQGSTKLLQLRMETHVRNDPDAHVAHLYQTGYLRNHPVGKLLYIMTIVTFFGWYFLLAGATYMGYQDKYTDEQKIRIVQAFCFIFNLGFFWNLALYWPYSIESLFYRRCDLKNATEVAVHYYACLSTTKGMQSSVFKSTTSMNLSQHGVGTHNETEQTRETIDRTINPVRRLLGSVMGLVYAERPVHDYAPNEDHMRETEEFSDHDVMVEYCPIHTNPDDGSRYFVFLFRRYTFNNKEGQFVPGTLSVGSRFAEMKPEGMDTEGSTPNLNEASGLTPEGVMKRRSIIGPNMIEMKKPSLWTIFRREISKPFYLYQFHILWIWITIEYWYMMITNWTVILITACAISLFRYRSANVLHGLSHVVGKLTVLRGKELVELNQSEIVPGDIVQLEPGIIHCDMVLLTGSAIVDESALTGEAIAHSKLPIDVTSEELYDTTLHKRQTLSAGTRIVEVHQAMALVTKTASFTRKGELLREVIAFHKHQVQYEVDLPYALFILGIYGSILWFIVFFKSSSDLVVAWYLGVVAISNALPPLLPISFTVPLGYSFERLSKSRVVCSKSDAILTVGEVTKVFFDKTGTLTKQGLDYTDCHSVEKSKFVNSVSDNMALAMASCHTLVMSSKDRSLIGNNIDRAMFGASKAEIHEEAESDNKQTVTIMQENGSKIEVLRRFDFDHYLMTQSVIVRLENGSVMAFSKGSGEAIRNICYQVTLPQDFDETLEDFARDGAYQIAVAFKRLPSCEDSIAALTREQVEEDMTLAGTLSFSNELRSNSTKVISDLLEANVQPVMLTGDNLHTGLHIARETGIVGRETRVTLGVIEDVGLETTWLDENDNYADPPSTEQLQQASGCSVVAMTGEAWRFLLKSQPRYAGSIAPFIRVVGRCSPHDKVSIVDTFVGLGHTTLMCGDGGNDCGALRAAHVGLALSDGDASLVSPFTSLDKDVESVLTVMKEGRATLDSTLAVYRFIILYGNITSYCQVIMYWMKASFTGEQWAFLDGVWTILFSLTLPLAKPAYKLATSCPTASLLSPQTVLSITGIVILNYAGTLWALCSLHSKEWFQCRQWNADKTLVLNISLAADNYEMQVLFLMVTAQLIAAAVTCNFGYEFRQSWYRNYLFVLILLSSITILVYITLVPSPLSCFFRVNCQNDDIVRGFLAREPLPINNAFNTTVMPLEFRYELLAIMIANGLVLAAYDYFVVNGIRRHKPKTPETYQPLVREKSIFTRSALVKKSKTGVSSFTVDMLESETFRPKEESAKAVNTA